MLRYVILFLLASVWEPHSYGQLVVYNNGKEQSLTEKNIQYYTSDLIDFSDSALLYANKEWKALQSDHIILKDIPQTIWFRIPLNDFLRNGAADFVQIKEPHINILKLWIVKDGEIIKSFVKTGDNQVYHSRPFATSSFIFSLHNDKTYQDCDLIIATDKRHSRYFVPVYFSSDTVLNAELKKSNWILGFFLGFTFLLILLYSYLFARLKLVWVKWYLVYLGILLLFILSDNALLFKYVYPDFPFINDVIRPVLLTANLIPYLHFFNAILKLKKNAPQLYRLNKWLNWVFIYLLFFAAITSYRSNYFLQSFWVTAGRVITPLCIIILFIEAVYCWYHEIKYAKWVLVLTFCGLYQVFIYIFFQYISIPYSAYVANSFYFRYLIEICIMLMVWVKTYKIGKEKRLNAS